MAIPAGGIAAWVLSLPAGGLPLLVLPLLVLTLEAIGIPPGLLKLSLLPPEHIAIAPGRLKLRPLPLEHIGIAPWRLRGEGPYIRLTRARSIRPGHGAWRAQGQSQAHPQDNTRPYLSAHPLLLPKIIWPISIC